MLEFAIGTEMNPPAEAQRSETLAHAVESLKRSERPLTGREILRSIPPPSRVDAGTLEQLLAGDPRVIAWPPRTRSAPLRYWIHRPEDVADSVLMEAMAAAPLTAGDLQKKIGRHPAGFSADQRRGLVDARLAALIAAGKLFQHPPPGRGKPKYSSQPATAGAYVAKLQKEVDALAAKLAPAGITRAQILDALASEAPAPASQADDLPRRILEYLKAKPAGVGLGQLREELGLRAGENDALDKAAFDKAAFDQAVLRLYRERRVYLDRHDYPQGLDAAARDQLVSDGDGSYFVVIGLRDADAESVP